MADAGHEVIDQRVWEDLQAKIEDDTRIRDELRDHIQELEKIEKRALIILSTGTCTGTVKGAIEQVEKHNFPAMIAKIKALASTASAHPYYKFNHMWSRQMQDAAFTVILCAWLGGLGKGKEGKLLSIEETGEILKVPVNLKDRDAFHLTIEEYLQALINLIDELSRFARNSVTQGNFERPLAISQFIKDLHAGFQILNLKNDNLRRRSDSIKYRVREVEDVVYDLSLRGLVPKSDNSGDV
ncbi:MAG: hypothetical protein M1831_007017 [Alyxoria varia]|nr:MAG: hypothetical protein M1831_007017 [Alyxoria varia]